jgi:hypothetical protein
LFFYSIQFVTQGIHVLRNLFLNLLLSFFDFFPEAISTFSHFIVMPPSRRTPTCLRKSRTNVLRCLRWHKERMNIQITTQARSEEGQRYLDPEPKVRGRNAMNNEFSASKSANEREMKFARINSDAEIENCSFEEWMTEVRGKGVILTKSIAVLPALDQLMINPFDRKAKRRLRSCIFLLFAGFSLPLQTVWVVVDM